jgi:hypothetical protein
MTSRSKQFFALAGLSVTELFRQPACFLLILCSSTFTILVPMAVSHQLGQTGHLAVDSSLAFELVFGMLLAGYASCSTLHNECRSGTILIVFSKPVGRLMYFLSKFSAVALMMGFFIYCSALSSLLAERLAPRNFEFDTLGLWLLLATPFIAFLPPAVVNFRRRRAFIPRALALFALTLTAWVFILGSVDGEGHRTAFASLMDWRLLPAALLEGMALLLMAAIALSLASRLSAPTTVAILAVVLMTGLISDHLATLVSSPVARFSLAMLLPDIQAFWPADKLAGSGVLSLTLISHAAGYALAYGTGILCLGYAAFRNRQF